MTPTLIILHQPDDGWPTYIQPNRFIHWCHVTAELLRSKPQSKAEEQEYPLDLISARFLENMAREVAGMQKK